MTQSLILTPAPAAENRNRVSWRLFAILRRRREGEAFPMLDRVAAPGPATRELVAAMRGN